MGRTRQDVVAQCQLAANNLNSSPGLVRSGEVTVQGPLIIQQITPWVHVASRDGSNLERLAGHLLAYLWVLLVLLPGLACRDKRALELGVTPSIEDHLYWLDKRAWGHVP